MLTMAEFLIIVAGVGFSVGFGGAWVYYKMQEQELTKRLKAKERELKQQ